MRKQLLAALVPFACVLSPAHADVFSSFGGPHDAVESGSEILFSADTFAGVFDFTLSTLSKVSFTGATTLPFLGFGLFDASSTLVSGAIFSPITFENSVTSVTLAPGSYFYKPIFPTSATAGSVVAFESTVTAVPEPRTYALMLAGIGMVGFSAFRRMRNDTI